LVHYLWNEPKPANIPVNDNTKGALRVDIAEFRNESLNSDSKNKNPHNEGFIILLSLITIGLISITINPDCKNT
jgi:hypothetical protein